MRRALFVILLLVASAVCVLVVGEGHVNDNGLAALLAFTGLALFFGGIGTAFWPLYRKAVVWDARRLARDQPDIDFGIDFGIDYIAAYSRQQKVIAVALASFCGWLTIFFFRAQSYEIEAALCGGLFLFFGWYALHVLFARVRLGSERIWVRGPAAPEYSQPYDAIKSIRCGLSTIHVRFKDGRSAKIHWGMGHRDVVRAHLRRKRPRRVGIEDSGL